MKERTLTSYEGTIFEGFTPDKWALWFIESYGQIDGVHHKQWVLDQVARILLGTQVILVETRWDDGYVQHYPKLGEPSDGYKAWVEKIGGEDGEDGYDAGIAP